MVSTDRAFRALARASPRTVLMLLRLLSPDEVPGDVEARAIALEDPHLDVPAHPREADWAALVDGPGDERLFHTECQGYGDAAFPDRVCDYHLMFVLRHPERRVMTFAIWMRRPPDAQRAMRIERGNVTVVVRSIVLSEVPAALLLSAPETACFAPGAALGELSVDELCDRVVSALARSEASMWERAMAAVAAATTGRYHSLVRAMERKKMEPVIIEDLVDYGFDLGMQEGVMKGRQEGRQEGRLQGRQESLTAAILQVLDARGLEASVEDRARLVGEHDLERLGVMLRRAVTAATVADLFD